MNKYINSLRDRYRVIKNNLWYSRDIWCHVPKSTIIGHNGIGLVISSETILGKNIQLGQNVTIGEKNGGHPTIKDNVKIYTNSVIIGNITIGENSIIGASTFINKDIPANSIVYGNPIIIKKNEILNNKNNKGRLLSDFEEFKKEVITIPYIFIKLIFDFIFIIPFIIYILLKKKNKTNTTSKLEMQEEEEIYRQKLIGLRSNRI